MFCAKHMQHSQTHPINSCFHISVPAHAVSGISQDKSTIPVSVSQLHTLYTHSAPSPQHTDNPDAPDPDERSGYFSLTENHAGFLFPIFHHHGHPLYHRTVFFPQTFLNGETWNSWSLSVSYRMKMSHGHKHSSANFCSAHGNAMSIVTLTKHTKHLNVSG